MTDTGSVEAPTDPGAVTIDEVVSALRVDMDEGLSADEVSRRRSSFGTNELGSVQSRPWWRLVWDQLADAVIVLLIAAAVAGFAVGEVVEAAAIGVVLVVNTIVGFATEFRAARSMESLRALMTTRAEATRRQTRRDRRGRSGSRGPDRHRGGRAGAGRRQNPRGRGAPRRRSRSDRRIRTGRQVRRARRLGHPRSRSAPRCCTPAPLSRPAELVRSSWRPAATPRCVGSPTSPSRPSPRKPL